MEPEEVETDHKMEPEEVKTDHKMESEEVKTDLKMEPEEVKTDLKMEPEEVIYNQYDTSNNNDNKTDDNEDSNKEDNYVDQTDNLDKHNREDTEENQEKMEIDFQNLDQQNTGDYSINKGQDVEAEDIDTRPLGTGQSESVIVPGGDIENERQPSSTVYSELGAPVNSLHMDRGKSETSGGHSAKNKEAQLQKLIPGTATIGKIPTPAVYKEERRTKPAGGVAGPATTAVHSNATNYTKYPTRMIKLATVTVNSSGSPKVLPLRPSRSSRFVEIPPSRRDKLLSLDEAINARPPLLRDMEGPTACAYTPATKPLNETNSPMWSFGRKTFVEKKGGTRTSWEKTWFQTPHIWQQKCDFHNDQRWPAPTHYDLRPTLGPKQNTVIEFPSFSIGIRRSTDIHKKGSEAEPGPYDYNPVEADDMTSRRAPSFTHGMRRSGTHLWSNMSGAPGPGSYNPNHKSTLQHKPAFTIQGLRREKSHVLGPFATF